MGSELFSSPLLSSPLLHLLLCLFLFLSPPSLPSHHAARNRQIVLAQWLQCISRHYLALSCTHYLDICDKPRGLFRRRSCKHTIRSIHIPHCVSGSSGGAVTEGENSRPDDFCSIILIHPRFIALEVNGPREVLLQVYMLRYVYQYITKSITFYDVYCKD